MGLLDKLRANASNKTPEPEDRVKDPVCGMRIHANAAAGTSERKGQTIHFCSLSCKARFDADPAKYVA